MSSLRDVALSIFILSLLSVIGARPEVKQTYFLLDFCVGDDGSYHDPGEKWSIPDVCKRFSCNENAQVFTESCGRSVPRDNCKTIPGIEGVFPNCCPKMICPAG